MVLYLDINKEKNYVILTEEKSINSIKKYHKKFSVIFAPYFIKNIYLLHNLL